MNFFVENIYTVILMPLWISMIFLFGKIFAVFNSKKVVNTVSVLSGIYCFIFAVCAFIKTVVDKGYIYEDTFSFLKIYDYSFNFGIYYDGVSAWLLLLTAIISLLVLIYSFYFMKDEKGYIRFLGLIQFFNFSIFGLLLSQNMFQMYVFWELVGISSYLLIGFWYNDISVSVSAKKTFIINRIGDFSLLCGIILFSGIIHSTLNNTTSVSLPFSEIPYLSAQIFGCTSDLMFITVCILLLGGAVAKSAQFPLHSWLIDAMKGPVPVSALIHSATMVAAGVFLLIRLYPLFSLSDFILNLISIIGIITAIICSFAALSQTDIKKVLAFSTNAHLGLMFLAIGCCSATVALFHLTSHAFAKAMLFLSAGVIIKALNNTQDIKMMGGLRKEFPLCAYTFLIGVFSLSGLLFSGFSSKEMILAGLIESKHYIYAVLFVVVAFMTVYYLFRLYLNVFEGGKNYKFVNNNSPKMMTVIPAVMALFVILIWCVLPKSGNWILTLLTYFIAFLAFLSSLYFYKNKIQLKKLYLIYSISFNAFYVENIISYVVFTFNRISRIIHFIEKYVFEGIVYAASLFSRLCALTFSKMQTGNVQSYLSYSLFILMIGFGGVMLVYVLIIYLSEVQ